MEVKSKKQASLSPPATPTLRNESRPPKRDIGDVTSWVRARRLFSPRKERKEQKRGEGDSLRRFLSPPSSLSKRLLLLNSFMGIDGIKQTRPFREMEEARTGGFATEEGKCRGSRIFFKRYERARESERERKARVRALDTAICSRVAFEATSLPFSLFLSLGRVSSVKGPRELQMVLWRAKESPLSHCWRWHFSSTFGIFLRTSHKVGAKSFLLLFLRTFFKKKCCLLQSKRKR